MTDELKTEVNQQRNPPDCSWCFGDCDDPELCTCNGGGKNIADCPSKICDFKRSRFYAAFEEALFSVVDLSHRRDELRIDDEEGKRQYIQANCGPVLQWIVLYVDIEHRIEGESYRREKRRKARERHAEHQTRMALEKLRGLEK